MSGYDITVKVRDDGGADMRIQHPGKDGGRGVDVNVDLSPEYRVQLIELLGGVAFCTACDGAGDHEDTTPIGAAECLRVECTECDGSGLRDVGKPWAYPCDCDSGFVRAPADEFARMVARHTWACPKHGVVEPRIDGRFVRCSAPHWAGVCVHLLKHAAPSSVIESKTEGHGMVPGSHERPVGPECRCGAAWDRWNDCCAAESKTEKKEG